MIHSLYQSDTSISHEVVHPCSLLSGRRGKSSGAFRAWHKCFLPSRRCRRLYCKSTSARDQLLLVLSPHLDLHQDDYREALTVRTSNGNPA